MGRFVEGSDRSQTTLLPECLDDWIDEDNPVRVIDAFVDAIGLGELGFDGVVPEATGRPAYHPGVLLKLYIYGYLNRVQSSRRLEREAGRNVEVMWLTGRLVPDNTTIAASERTMAAPSARSCPRFVRLCREMGPGVIASADRNLQAQRGRSRGLSRPTSSAASSTATPPARSPSSCPEPTPIPWPENSAYPETSAYSEVDERAEHAGLSRLRVRSG